MPEGSLAFVTPTLNEAPFIRAWIANVQRFADQIVVADCGSTDGTVEILEAAGIRVLHENIGGPYNWPEGAIRNRLLCSHSCDYTVILDADELLLPTFLDTFHEAPKRDFYRMLHMDFWYSINLIRVRQLRRDWWRRFYPSTQIRVLRNAPRIAYRESGNHAPLLWYGMGNPMPRASSYTLPCGFFHAHRVSICKENENRAQEKHLQGIKLRTYWGPYPPEISYYQFPLNRL